METLDEVPTTIHRHAAAAEWDGRVESWRSTCAGPAFLRFRDSALEAAALRPTDRVLDIGCGTGLLALEAALRAASVVALDVAPRMLQEVRSAAEARGLGNVSLVCADATRLPLGDDEVDCVMSSYALHHLDHAAKMRALAEARRVLRPGGRLVIVDMMFSLSLRADDRTIILGKVWQILRKGPGGAVRLARNAFRIGRGRWEHPASRDWWIDAAVASGFADITVVALEHEAGMLTAVRPE